MPLNLEHATHQASIMCKCVCVGFFCALPRMWLKKDLPSISLLLFSFDIWARRFVMPIFVVFHCCWKFGFVFEYQELRVLYWCFTGICLFRSNSRRKQKRKRNEKSSTTKREVWLKCKEIRAVFKSDNNVITFSIPDRKIGWGTEAKS